MDLISVYGLLSMAIFTLLLYRLKALTSSLLFNPFVMPLMAFSISLGTVFYVASVGAMTGIQLYTILFFFGSFIVGIFFLKFIISKKKYLNESNSIIKAIDYQVLYFLFVISVIISFMYVILLWSSYASGDERLLLNRQYRSLSLVKMLLDFWVVVLAAVIYSQNKNKVVLAILFVTVVFSFFSGSKGAALGFLLWALMFYFNFNTVNKRQLIIVFCLFVLVLLVPTWWMYGDSFIEKIVFRISMSGDVYLLAFISGDYTQLTEVYNPVAYLFHPFTSLIGIRGYEYPFGAELIGTAGYPVTGTGPNPHLPLLALTFWPNCFFCTSIFAIMMTVLFLMTVFIAFSMYNFLKLPLFFRVFLFSILLSAAFDLFFDIGAYQFKIILCFIGLIIYVLINFLKQISHISTNHKELE